MTKQTRDSILATVGFALLIGVPAVWGNWDYITRKYAETFHPAETAAADAKMEADFEAGDRIVERHLSAGVVQNRDAFTAHDGPQTFLLTVEKVGGDAECDVFTPESVKSVEENIDFPMKDLEEQARRPIYLVRHASAEVGWEIKQGGESCFVAVSTSSSPGGLQGK